MLCGILFSGGDAKTAAGVVATDGRRLYREPVPALSALGGDFIVPNKVLDLLGNAVFSADWQMGFLPGVESFRKRSRRIALGDDVPPARIVSSLLEEGYVRVDLVTDKSLTESKARLILPTVRYAAHHG